MTLPDIAVDLAPNNPRELRLANPVIAASGCFGYGQEYAHLIDVQRPRRVRQQRHHAKVASGECDAAHHRDAGGNAERDRTAESRHQRIHQEISPALGALAGSGDRQYLRRNG